MKYSNIWSSENSQIKNIKNNMTHTVEKLRTQSWQTIKSKTEKSPSNHPNKKSSDEYVNSVRSGFNNLHKSPRCYDNLYMMK